MRDSMDIVKALADENRVRALCALKDRELCVCQIIALLELAPSTVSKHMSILRQARLVEARKNGRWMYYRVPGKDAEPIIRDTIEWVFKAFSGAKEMMVVEQRLKKILRMEPHDLCRILSKNCPQTRESSVI